MNSFHRLQQLRMENDEVKFGMDVMRERFTALRDRVVNDTAPRAVSAYQLFQTPDALAQEMADVLEIRSRPHMRILEPSAGLGRLLPALKKRLHEIVAVELTAECSAELYRQHPDVKLYQRDFLQCLPSELGAFDRVIMNPPFHMRSDIKHIEHALKFLSPGGRLVALCLDTPHREKALRDRADFWKKIPAGTFRAEGTNVATILLSIRP